MTTTPLADILTANKPSPNGHATIYNLRMGDKLRGGSVLLWSAAVLLLALAAAQGYVSWRAQYAFVYAAKHASLPSALEAIGLDTGALIFALLGLAHARMGRPARIERILNVACALGSAAMNLLAADLGSPRSVAVYVLPAVLYAACSDRLIATAGHMAGTSEPSVWRFTGVAGVYLLRAVVAFPSTMAGLRRKILLLAPVPPAADLIPSGNLAVSYQTGPAGESKTAHLLRLYATHPDHGDRTRVSKVAAELAPQAGLQPGSARTILYKAVDGATR